MTLKKTNLKAVITTSFNSGLGDMCLGYYQIYYLQEQLKQIGYEVKTIIDLGRSPYKTTGEDRNIFRRIFNFDFLDDLEIILGNLEHVKTNLRDELIEVYKYEHVHSVFVNIESDNFTKINHVKHSWYYRDDLPKINLFNTEVIDYCESKCLKIPKINVGLHYRPFSSDNENNIQSDLETFKNDIHSILEKNSDEIVFVSTNKNLLKEYLKNSSYKNVYVNDFVFPNVHEAIRSLNLNDDALFEILRETIFDMFLLSKCEKIYRIANWFSAFLSFACLYNQTDVSNRLRFYPEHPIIPL